MSSLTTGAVPLEPTGALTILMLGVTFFLIAAVFFLTAGLISSGIIVCRIELNCSCEETPSTPCRRLLSNDSSKASGVVKLSCRTLRSDSCNFNILFTSPINSGPVIHSNCASTSASAVAIMVRAAATLPLSCFNCSSKTVNFSVIFTSISPCVATLFVNTVFFLEIRDAL